MCGPAFLPYTSGSLVEYARTHNRNWLIQEWMFRMAHTNRHFLSLVGWHHSFYGKLRRPNTTRRSLRLLHGLCITFVHRFLFIAIEMGVKKEREMEIWVAWHYYIDRQTWKAHCKSKLNKNLFTHYKFRSNRFFVFPLQKLQKRGNTHILLEPLCR